MGCEEGAVVEGFAKDDDLLIVDVPPNDGVPPKGTVRGVIALGVAAKEMGLKASEVVPREGASPLKSNGMVPECAHLPCSAEGDSIWWSQWKAVVCGVVHDAEDSAAGEGRIKCVARQART